MGAAIGPQMNIQYKTTVYLLSLLLWSMLAVPHRQEKNVSSTKQPPGNTPVSSLTWPAQFDRFTTYLAAAYLKLSMCMLGMHKILHAMDSCSPKPQSADAMHAGTGPGRQQNACIANDKARSGCFLCP